MSAYVTEALGNALIALMKEKPMDKITVDELTALAGIGRATYFRNFASREAVLTDYIILKWQENEKQLDLSRYAADEHYRVCSYFHFCEAMHSVNALILSRGCEMSILRAYESIIRSASYSHPDDSTYETAFLAYGLYGIFLRWMRSGCRETPEEMTEIIISQIFSRKVMEMLF